MSLAKLKKACKNCKPSSIQTYWYNIKTLARIAGKDDIPANANWLNAALRKRVNEMPLQRRKRYAAAAVKANQMYGKKDPQWIGARVGSNTTGELQALGELALYTTNNLQHTHTPHNNRLRL